MVKPQRSILFGPMPPPWGGVSVFMNSIAASAIARGAEIWAYAGKPHATPSVRFVNHRRFSHLWMLMRRGRGARITDSTHFHLEYPHPALLPPWIALKKSLGFRWIKIVHDGSLPYRFEKFSATQMRLFRAAVKWIDEIIAVDQSLASWLLNTAGFRGKIAVIPPLLPTPGPGSGTGGITGAQRNTLDNFALHKKKVLSIGVFAAPYGFDQVAHAVESIRTDSGEDIGLLLGDSEFDLDTEYRDRVLAGRDWIHVVKSVSHSALAGVYCLADVFVRAFERESFGLSRVEALWAGVPVVATRAGETRGMLIYDFGDIDQLSAHIRSALGGDIDNNAAECAEAYRHEAKENLERYLTEIRGAVG
ncbi:MAG TPA: glycosyltransferase family 4 protein [Pyrinomonadaceae bacterium]|nr:glycosyltransferase family 4 protein [Pyrinomonadaceae bacterium]